MHEKKLAEAYAPITEEIEEVDKSTENIGEVTDKAFHTATKNLTPILQSSRRQKP